MTKKQPPWMFGTPGSKPNRGGVPEAVKAEVSTKANDLIETVLKPQYIQPPADNPQFNYIVDLYGKWYQRYFYLCATYRVPDPDARVASFEVKCARIEYSRDNRFHLSFPRHTGQWVELYTDLPLDECLVSIRDEPFFFP
ncbi:hypothetical protein KSC_057090 [Ktedonobacter sp. SOSP1-52]|uniref:DUF3024 domain-containing protein n=1 Tax=Ktedonobacter sp. SOSP1-52 TaxID=2778366 RepID=UPI001915050F|nr:hypothetical protein [Ktedonobacter sp. SOSP1-52]GHO66817.1 hypothetical protein KSC_057090 [Ktedonobacter sp. SOSP1-52]